MLFINGYVKESYFDEKIRNIETTIRPKLNTIDWLIIKKLLFRNIKKVSNLLLRPMEINYETQQKTEAIPLHMKKSKIFPRKTCHLKN